MEDARWIPIVRRAVLLAGVIAANVAWGVDVPVTYTLEQSALRAAAAATPLTFDLHADSACSAAIYSVAVDVADVALIERVRTFKVRGAPSGPRVVRLSHVITGAPPSGVYYLRISGTGIAAVGGACQPQLAPQASDVPCATQVGTEVYFTGCNVNVRNGTGTSTGGGNGLGNLVVGYNETDGTLARTGSHNVVVGPAHSYDATSSMAVGSSHTTEGECVSVSGRGIRDQRRRERRGVRQEFGGERRVRPRGYPRSRLGCGLAFRGFLSRRRIA